VAADDDDGQRARFETYRRTRDVELRNALVEEHATLAQAFARRYDRRGVQLDDLQQVAAMGLLGAVERFDPSLGVRFTTFASRTIDGELKRHFRDRAWSVRVPRRYQDLGVAVRATIDTLSKELGRSPTIPELAEAVGAEVDEVLATMEAAQAFRSDSIDAPSGDDDSSPTIADRLGTVDAGPGALENRAVVGDLLARLPDRERRIVELRFFGEMSQREIADEIGVSQMHVSRLLRQALATLRTSVDRDVLDDT
jgi:RNA polymerase sigma-B factor